MERYGLVGLRRAYLAALLALAPSLLGSGAAQGATQNTIINARSVGEMRGFGSGQYTWARIDGNTAPGDGLGGGIYYWDAASTCSDDAILCIKPTQVSGAGRWLLAPMGYAFAPGIVTDAKTAAITAEGSPFTSKNTTAYTANQILQYTFGASAGSATGTSYDGGRSIAYAPASSTVSIINGFGSYVISDAATAGSGFPAAVGLFSAGVAKSNDAKVWGVNTLLTDTTTYAISAGTGKALNNEFDFNVTSTGTTVLGLQLAGSSVAQPASAYGIALQPLDSPNFGTVSRWTAFLTSTEGSTDVFASVGAKAHTGTSIKSQDLNLNFKDSAGADGNVVLTGSEAGGLEVLSSNSLARAVTITGGAGRFAVEDMGGFNINNRIAMTATTSTFTVGSDINWTTQNYGNGSATTNIFGSAFSLQTLPGSAGAGGLFVCVDTSGVLYKKAVCP